jgi:hypothetical protein
LVWDPKIISAIILGAFAFTQIVRPLMALFKGFGMQSATSFASCCCST